MSSIPTMSKNIETCCDGFMKLVDGLEDLYRNAGMKYHKTELRARHTDIMPLERLMRLKDAFETSRNEEYNAIFARVYGIAKSLADLRSDALRFRSSQCGNTSSERYHHFSRVLMPKLDTLTKAFAEQQAIFVELDIDAGIMHHLGEEFYDTIGDRQVGWFDEYDPYGPGMVPLRKGEEWQTFRAWVWSLPETQRAVQAGRVVDDAALELLSAVIDGEKLPAAPEEVH